MTTPHPLQAGPRKLKKNDNVKNRVRLDSLSNVEPREWIADRY